MNGKPLLRTLDWDAIGGLIAAVLAIVLHLLGIFEEPVLLGIFEEPVLLVITSSLLALLFLRDLREETETEELTQSMTDTERRVAEIRAAMTPLELEFVGPDSLHTRFN